MNLASYADETKTKIQNANEGNTWVPTRACMRYSTKKPMRI